MTEKQITLKNQHLIDLTGIASQSAAETGGTKGAVIDQHVQQCAAQIQHLLDTMDAEIQALAPTQGEED